MNRLHHSHNIFQLTRRAAWAEPEPLHALRSPTQTTEDPIIVAAIGKRADSTSSSSGSSTPQCTTTQNLDTCSKPTDTNPTLPIVLGACIPIACALVVLFILHRRHVRKTRLEDANDKHKSLDFGLDDVSGGKASKKNKGAPEMSVADAEKSIGRGRGLSLDLGSSPFVLPSALHGSKESLHSLSRAHDKGDPYRPSAYLNRDDSSTRYPRIGSDNASGYTDSSVSTDAMNANLLRHAKQPSKSFPARGDSMSPADSLRSDIPAQSHSASSSGTQNGNLAVASNDTARDSYFDKNAQEMRKSSNYLGTFIHSRDPSADISTAAATEKTAPAAAEGVVPQISVHSVTTLATSAPANGAPSENARPPRLQSMEASIHTPSMATFPRASSEYGDGFKVTPPSPPRVAVQQHQGRQSLDIQMPIAQQPVQGLGVITEDDRRLSILRPLPPDDPTETSEERANRIRSFYREYFDESKPEPVGRHGYGDYVEDYGSEYLNESTIYDPRANGFVVAQRPYAQPVTRRAMTPPPRAPPRFKGASRSGAPKNSADNARRSTDHVRASMDHPRRQSNDYPIGSRNPSAMSNRTQLRGRPFSPPPPLKTLPTPHMLKDDMSMLAPIDFAPPTTFRDQQIGRAPDSPVMIQRPYSPAVRAHNPLASSFESLPSMPSPHALRKSGTFTALDFAPLPRFAPDSNRGSDIDSVRSSGSLSPVQLRSLRAGAGRVSRIPKEVVGTKNDLATALRPTWDLRGSA